MSRWTNVRRDDGPHEYVVEIRSGSVERDPSTGRVVRRFSTPPPDAYRERALAAEAQVRALEETVGELLGYLDDEDYWRTLDGWLYA